MPTFSDKIGLVMGVANDRSIAWAISKALYAEGAELAFTHLPGPSSERRVTELVGPRGPKVDPALQRAAGRGPGGRVRAVRAEYGRLDFLVHSVAFAPPAELRQPYVEMSRDGWRLAMDISVYSLVTAARAAAPLMTNGGTIITISYFGGEKVVPGYNVMGVCKAALEHSVRYLAWDLGRRQIRVNCHQRRPHADAERLRHRRLRRIAPARREEIAAGPQRRSQGYRRDRRSTCSAMPPAASPARPVHVDCGYSIVGL